jgi:predicted nicotinamide N-methyase
VRFDRPYLHPFQGGHLTIHQQRFRELGFASTVWDSSVVLAKHLENCAQRYAGKRCLDLSAGCGLPGIVLSKLRARVTATDLAPNLALLRKNAAANGALLEPVKGSTHAC